MTDAAHLSQSIKKIEEAALAVLKPYGIKEWQTAENRDETKNLALMRSFLQALNKTSNQLRKNEIWQAHTALEGIYRLNCIIASGDTLEIAVVAIGLGYEAAKLDSLSAIEPVISGRKVRKYAANLREMKKIKTEPKHKKVLELFIELKAQYEPHERPSDSYIMRNVSKHLKMKFSSVKSIIYRNKLSNNLVATI
jgi:hypothetical protein